MSADSPDAARQRTPTTVVIGQPVKAGREDEYRAWQTELNDAAREYPGFLGAEITPPAEPGGEWNVVYRFDSVPHLQSWLNSATRQRHLDAGADLFDGPATQQVVAGGESAEELVTVVVTHKVSPGMEGQFQEWQERMTEGERAFPGFRGSELFRPVPGVQDEWTAVYRFDTGENLERWLASEERRTLLDEAEQFQDFRLRKIQNSFGSWFDFATTDGEEAEGPNDFKTSIAVWAGLYPTVMLLTLGIAELFPDAKLWQALLVGNLLSSLVMTYFTMPRYVNPVLRFWLTAGRDAPQPATNLKAAALVGVMIGGLVVIFWLTTTVIWTLP